MPIFGDPILKKGLVNGFEVALRWLWSGLRVA
jgi:hypothetical protein